MAKTQAKYIYHKEEIFLKILKTYQTKQKRKQITKKKKQKTLSQTKSFRILSSTLLWLMIY